jgi:phosphomannomutase
MARFRRGQDNLYGDAHATNRYDDAAMTSSLKFGTSGLRGLVEDLVGAPAYAYTRAFAATIRGNPAFAGVRSAMIGRDLRASSPEIAAVCVQAISDSGLDAIDCGAVPTPALALAAMGAGLPAVMVTGSHIPEDRNGLKFYTPRGEIGKADEAGILSAHETLSLSAAPPMTARARLHDAATPYATRYLDAFGPHALDGLTVGVYQHSSVARDIICDVLGALDAIPVALGRADSFIPVDTEALRPEDEDLARRWAAGQRLDAIVSTDGDADRPLVADEKGMFLRGDLVAALTAKLLGADAIVTPVTSNSALESQFAEVRRTRVGSPYVIEGMAAAIAGGARLVVGFEANGGVMLGSDARLDGRSLPALQTRDAMLPIVASLAVIAREKRPLSAIAADMRFAVALSNRLQNVPQDRTAALIAALDADDPAFRNEAFAAQGGVASRDRRDGLRLTLRNGATAHFRASGNAPELRVYVEAATQDFAEDLLRHGLEFARRSVG